MPIQLRRTVTACCRYYLAVWPDLVKFCQKGIIFGNSLRVHLAFGQNLAHFWNLLCNWTTIAICINGMVLKNNLASYLSRYVNGCNGLRHWRENVFWYYQSRLCVVSSVTVLAPSVDYSGTRTVNIRIEGVHNDHWLDHLHHHQDHY